MGSSHSHIHCGDENDDSCGRKADEDDDDDDTELTLKIAPT